VRAVFPAVAALALLPLAAALTACSDPFASGLQLVQLDSMNLAAAGGPLSVGATAVDLSVNNTPRFPELNPGDGTSRGAGVQKTTRTIESPGSAPRQSASYTRTQVSVVPGDAFYVQTRQRNPQCSTVPKYGLVKVVSVSADSGTARLAVLSNQACGDERLKP
jgi:hypothetical protein